MSCEKILLMDDEEMIREIVSEVLIDFGYEVEVAEDGLEAIELYQKARASGRPFDILIMDLTVSNGMGADEAIKKLHELDPHVKAIISSGYANDPVMSQFAEYGFIGRIIKPYDIKELKATLHEVMLIKEA